jgi:glutamate/tyrosine decarboxylase-like PLP-dependent enzyme
MRARLGGPPPLDGETFDQVLNRLSEHVLPFASRCEHPRYFAFIPASGTWPGALGDFIAAAVNPYVGSWMEAAGPTQVELEVLRWFAEWVGYPEGSAGVLVGGGSLANMTALACAREARLGAMTDRAVAYVSDQAHSSMARGARVLGFQPHQVRVLPVDRSYRMRPDALVDAMRADTRAGRTPLFVAASAGSTNTGGIDPLGELATVCAEHAVWLHVDAAYGGFATLTERGRAALSGIERADSVTLDPHKWLYQPFECGCLLVRDGDLLRRAFEITPDYLKDAQVHAGEVNFSDLGVQLTRGFRALKVWMSLQCFGTRAFSQAIDNCLDLALAAQRRIEASAELELLTPASLGVVCFRRRPAGVDDEAALDRLNAELVARLAASGGALVSSTRLRGRYAVRLCVLNHASTAADVQAVLEWFERETPRGPASERPVEDYERNPAVAHALGAGGATEREVSEDARADPSVLRALDLFASLGEVELERVRSLAAQREVAAGETIVEQWDLGRDFYVVVDGIADVARGGEHVNEVGPGGFFGELAALEWGASFTYSRMASVVARTPMRLLVFAPEALSTLIVELPSLERAVAAVRGRRLAAISGEPEQLSRG